MQASQVNNKFIAYLGLGILTIVWLSTYLSGPSIPKVNNITSIEVASLIEAKDTIILDVREKEAFDKGHIAGAISIPIGDIDKRLDELHALNAEEVIVYCNDGSTRGPRATKQLNDAGFAKAKNLKGGAQGWEKAGFKLVTQ